MEQAEPSSALGVADVLRSGKRIVVTGAGTKLRMGGPLDRDAETLLTTNRLNTILRYEPRDLTISVGAGMRFADLERVLAEHHQMLPLDPPFSREATVGGIVASNSSGPRRRLYGTARDLVIGMQFATRAGRLVDTGGMVVKNVAGLDMGKLMIGSFGTLAVITKVNFKVHPTPAAQRTIAMEFGTVNSAIAVRDRWLRNVLQPGAIDLLSPEVSEDLGFLGWTLLLWFGGNGALMERCSREAALLGPSRTCDNGVWARVQQTSPAFLERFPDGAVVRVSSRLSGIGKVMELCRGRCVARAGTGVTYAFFEHLGEASERLAELQGGGFRGVVESGPKDREGKDLWPNPGTDFEVMRKMKALFDPAQLLNRGRMYGRV